MFTEKILNKIYGIIMELHMNSKDFIVSKTDLKGKITYCNQTFIEISGYSEEELLGTPHNILRHKDMPKIVFKLLWDRIQNKQGIYAYVKNSTKNGDFYWVLAYVTASLDPNGNIIGYYSIRRKPTAKALETISAVYQELLHIEKQSGVSASEKHLLNLLEKQGVSYEQFILSLSK